MKTFRIKQVYLALNNNKRSKKSKVIPANKEVAKKLILEYVAEAIGGEIDIDKGTVITHINLKGNFSCLHKLGCAAKFSEVR